MTDVILRVCVVALTHSQHGDMDSRILKKLGGKSSVEYDVTKNGIVYGDSPDEWHPFEDNKTVLEYLREAGFMDSSLTNLITSMDDINSFNSLTTDVDLYVFDPLFLTLGESYLPLINHLQGVIGSSNKPFCILIPERLPKQVIQELEEICTLKLPLLKLAYENGNFCEWKAENPLRLRAFLSKLYRHSKALPQQERLDIFAKLLEINGVPSIYLPESPKLIGGT